MRKYESERHELDMSNLENHGRINVSANMQLNHFNKHCNNEQAAIVLGDIVKTHRSTHAK